MSYEPWFELPPAPLATMPARQVYAPAARPQALGALDPIGRAAQDATAGNKALLLVHGLIILAVAYHGFRRHEDSLLWGGAWAVGGVLCPTVTAAFAITQGFAKKGG